MLVHVVAVSVVGCDAKDSARFFDGGLDAAKLQVHSFHRANYGVENSGVANHVAVRIVKANVVVLSALNRFDYFVRDFGALHPGALLKGNYVRRNFDVSLKALVKFAGAVSVKEVCDVSVLLGFANRHKMNAALCQVLSHRAVDAGRVDQVLRGLVVVAVVLHHSRVLNGGNALSVKVREVFFFKGCRDFQGAVATEVKVNDTVSVFDCSDGLSVFRDDKLMHVLVKNAGNFLAVSFDRFDRAGELAAFAQNVGLPAALNHAPVGVVAVHCHVHAAAARGDLAVRSKAGQKFLQGSKVVQGACGRNVAAVKQSVNANLFYAFLYGLGAHGLKVVDVGVNVSVRNKADKVEG